MTHSLRACSARALSAIALAAVVSATPAFAQDATSAAATRDSHFDGLYIQGFGGYSAQSQDKQERLKFDTDGDGSYNNTVNTVTGANAFSPGFCTGLARGATPAAGCRGDRDGAEYGARIGYDRRMGDWVVGGLIEGTKSNARDGVSGYSTTPASYAIQREMDYSITARARAGYTPGGGALFYVTGGGGIAKLDHDFYTTNTTNAFDPQRDGKMVWGWQAGGGTEIMVTNKISLGLEYLYNRYYDDKYNVVVTQGSSAGSNPFIQASDATRIKSSDKNFDYHSLRATVGFRF
ncbi:membrane protein [Novosphingobium sp. Rr 2-17]|uniref:outer membrane protein n=1 Tax=Novosphingobium sp. Rr 2-17 TaxID=555793 RepID=UPI000269A225|nr:outer membrane beta-barrel protein [Novosphingobium sp. Rr 2-17]EIZ77841.1 membrane protein [Novosphingobium sp. Rr 2-17]